MDDHQHYTPLFKLLQNNFKYKMEFYKESKINYKESVEL